MFDKIKLDKIMFDKTKSIITLLNEYFISNATALFRLTSVIKIESTSLKQYVKYNKITDTFLSIFETFVDLKN